MVRSVKDMGVFVAITLAFVAGLMPAWAGDLSFSDPANVPAPPVGAIGFPNREPDFNVRPGFQHPPPGYGEVAFYWWLGDPLTKERLTWQLDQLAGKGVMGLQINYAHSDRGGHSYGLTFPSDPPLFSEDWWKLVSWFMQQAKQRGMAVSLSDYTLGIGQGWSVDEVLKENPDLAGSVLRSQSQEIAGGDVQWPVPAGTLMVAARDEGTGAVTDLRDQVVDGVLKWRAPAGPHRLVAVHAQQVQPSIDPMNPISGSAYAGKFFGQFEEYNPGEAGKGLNFFFSDELEFRVSGNLWTARFAEEFRKRKGYDILPELPALFVDIGPRTPKVRLDYSDVKVALTEEGFFKPVFEWHQKRGKIYGCDHGGRGRNVVEFGDYFRTQRWNQGPGCDQPGLGRDIIKNKVASSIAHLYLRPRVWLEGYHSSGWGTSSAQIADATFANFVMGQNLLTLHGLYYSTHGGYWEWAPPCNHFRMPYWKHMDELMQCVERLGYLLSQGHHRCDVAIVYPVAPTDAGLGGKESVSAAFSTGQHLYRQGIDFDFMDFESLARAKVVGTQLHVSGEAYRALVLPAMRAVRYSTLERAVEFQRAGGLVVVLGAPPEASDRIGRDDAQLAGRVAELTTRVERPEQVAGAVQRAFARDYDGPGYVMHRKIGPREVYAIYSAPRDSECFFRATGRVEQWDPWTGQIRPLRVLSQDAVGTRLKLPLSEKEVQLVVFSPGRPDTISPTAAEPAPQTIPLGDDWEFELQPVLDNRYGDYHWPPTPKLIAAQARQFRYADETVPNPGWQDPGFDDSKWRRVTSSFGPQFWKLGPLPADIELENTEELSPPKPVLSGGQMFPWKPYEFSWRWGIEGDPGHQGYHGLKENVHDEFIGLGTVRNTGTGTNYEKEEAGTRYYLWTSVVAPQAGEYYAIVGGLRPSAVWLGRRQLPRIGGKLELQAGDNPLLLRYDQPGRRYYVVSTTPPENRSDDAQPFRPLATTWYNDPSILSFDTRPNVARPVGWYRFTSPPGLEAMTILARGKVQAWADSKEMKPVDGNRFLVTRPSATSVEVAVRIEQERGGYGGAALLEPVLLDCGRGEITLGDWSRIDGLASYSGGARYRKTVTLSTEQTARNVTLDLGNVVASAEVYVNGKLAGIRVAPPWTLNISSLVQSGDNRIEVLVYNTLANHYLTIPTRYRGSPVSGLLGPVELKVTP